MDFINFMPQVFQQPFFKFGYIKINHDPKTYNAHTQKQTIVISNPISILSILFILNKYFCPISIFKEPLPGAVISIPELRVLSHYTYLKV